MLLEQLDIHMQSNKSIYMSYTFKKASSKWIQPKSKIQNYKTSRR